MDRARPNTKLDRKTKKKKNNICYASSNNNKYYVLDYRDYID